MNAAAGAGMVACMRSYDPELLATPVPRYTSFPTAAELTPAVVAGDFEQALGQLAGDVSLGARPQEDAWLRAGAPGEAGAHFPQPVLLLMF